MGEAGAMMVRSVMPERGLDVAMRADTSPTPCWNGSAARPAARLVDGADEVHKMVLADAWAAQGAELWRWGN